MKKYLVLFVFLAVIIGWAQITTNTSYGFSNVSAASNCKSTAAVTVCVASDGLYVSTGGSSTFNKLDTVGSTPAPVYSSFSCTTASGSTTGMTASGCVFK